MVTEIEVEIMIGKDKISDKPRMDMKMVTEEVIIDNTLVEATVEIEAGKTSGEIIVIMIDADQEKEAPHQEGILLDNIIAQVQIQDLGVDQTLGLQQIETELDVLDAESMITLQVNVQILVWKTLIVMNQRVQHCN